MLVPADATPDLKERIEGRVALVSFGYWKHYLYVKCCLESCRRTGLFHILVWEGVDDYDSTLTKSNVDLAILKHNFGRTKNLPWAYKMKYVLPVLEELGFESVIFTNSDVYLEKPEGWKEIISTIGKYDFISYWYSGKVLKGLGRYGTMVWAVKVKALRKLILAMIDNWYREPSPDGPEGRMPREVVKLGLKPYLWNGEAGKVNFDFRMPREVQQKSIFGRLMGIRHLQWEHRSGELREEEIKELECE
jgi:hypothetical protein